VVGEGAEVVVLLVRDPAPLGGRPRRRRRLRLLREGRGHGGHRRGHLRWPVEGRELAVLHRIGQQYRRTPRPNQALPQDPSIQLQRRRRRYRWYLGNGAMRVLRRNGTTSQKTSQMGALREGCLQHSPRRVLLTKSNQAWKSSGKRSKTVARSQCPRSSVRRMR
jgi:hypothetical protein